MASHDLETAIHEEPLGTFIDSSGRHMVTPVHPPLGFSGTSWWDDSGCEAIAEWVKGAILLVPLTEQHALDAVRKSVPSLAIRQTIFTGTAGGSGRGCTVPSTRPAAYLSLLQDGSPSAFLELSAKQSHVHSREDTACIAEDCELLVPSGQTHLITQRHRSTVFRKGGVDLDMSWHYLPHHFPIQPSAVQLTAIVSHYIQS